MITRIVFSAISVFVYVVAMMVYTPQATLISGQVAGRQFESSDSAYLTATYTNSLFTVVGALMTLALVVAFILIWYKPVKDAIAKAGNAVKNGSSALFVLLAAGAMLSGSSTESYAFFEKVNRTEVYLILPNESAFWIPDVGDNKTSQTSLDSEAYLNEKKIAAKRFIIPHQLLDGSAGYGVISSFKWDYYVPTGRLIVVDRTPYSREWVDSEDRGTSKLKQGFPCQTKEGLNITVGISIGTSVLEKDAAKFLYRFGVKSPVGQIKGDAASIEADGKIIFTSVYYGRSLAEVMDDVVRKKVQTLVCNEIGSRTFVKANEDAVQIITAVETKVKAYFEGVGITLDFIGWANTFEFDPEIQAAVNRLYIAYQDEAIAKLLAPHATTIQALASAQALREFGNKSDGKFPTTIVGMPSDVGGLLRSLMSAQPSAENK